uniref:Uncharacterized protein n=1 Tax=Anguilla anguilla TaxID=7936 RepID=A0A0E9SNP6_ANGAN
MAKATVTVSVLNGTPRSLMVISTSSAPVIIGVGYRNMGHFAISDAQQMFNKNDKRASPKQMGHLSRSPL